MVLFTSRKQVPTAFSKGIWFQGSL
jgi:hypothetical protein